MSFRFHPDAEAELLDSIQYYEDVEPGLGQDFAIEVYSAIQRAVVYPRAGESLRAKFGAHWCGGFPMESCILKRRTGF